MKSKILLKRTLPIIIALFVVVVVALVATVVTLDKKVPSLSKDLGKEAYLTYTNDGVSISMSKNDVYDLIRDENYGASRTITELVRMIDEKLLTNGSKNYLELASAEKVTERVEYAILGYTLADYKDANKKAFELAALKEGISNDAYLKNKVDEAIETFVKNFLTENAVELADGDVSFDGTNLNVNQASKVYKYYQLEEAKYLFAREQIEAEYNDQIGAYNTYLADKETYDKYQDALSRYESDLAKWKAASKKTRGDKPVKSDYISIYNVTKEPEEVSAPALVESNFKSKYTSDNVDKFWAVLIPYSSKDLAQDALSQNGVVIENGKWLNKDTKAELSDNEVVEKVISLYNQYYQNLGRDELTAAAFAPDFTNTDSEFYFTASKLTSYGLYAKNSTNNIYNYEDGYAYNDSLSSSIYLIVGRSKAQTWDEYLEAQDKKYYETEFYTSVLAELLDDATTTTYINKALAKLRYESDLLIYDTVLEKAYMSAYESDYKATKKASKTNVVSFKVNGKKEVITADELFNQLAGTQYGVSSFVYKYQYNWMFLEAKDANGNKFNKYVDYKAYLENKSYAKASTDETMYKSAKEYLANVKSNFKANAYADSEGNGYNSKYGFKAFIHDYYYENYNVNLNTEDDLMIFYVYQQLMDEYQKYVTKVTLDKWNNVYKIYMAKTASEYMSVTADELFISVLDATGAKVDLVYWTDAQLAAAKELYDKVIAALPKVEKDQVSAFLSGLETAFDKAPKALNGAYAGDYAYNYTYAVAGGTQVEVEVSKYKTLGLDVTSSSATFTNSSANEYLKYAARQIWKSLLPELIKGKAVSELVVYNTTWTPKAYYGVANGNYLASSDGLVVLATTSATFSNYFKTVGTTTSTSAAKDRIHALMAAYEALHAADANYKSFEDLYATWVDADDKTEIEATIFAIFKDQLALDDISTFSDIEDFFTTYVDDRVAFIGFPSLEYVLMYLYDKSKNAEDDYVSLDNLYDDYTDAVKDNEGIDAAKEAVMKIVEKYINDETLNVKFASFDEFLPYLEKYADSTTSAYVLSQVTTWFTTYSTSNSTLVYGDFSSTNYANREMFKTLLANLNANFTADDIVKKVMEELVNTSIDNANSSLSYLAFTEVNKEEVEKLINAVLDFNGFDYEDEDNLDVLFTYGDTYSAEKTTFTATINALKDYAKAQYNSLDATDKEALLDLATAAGLVD